VLEDRRLEILQVLRVDRVGRVVRERPVELGEQRDQPDREALHHGRNDEAAHAVRRVGHDRERGDRRRVDERQHVVDVLREHVALLDGPRRERRRELVAFSQRPDLAEAGVLAHRRGAGEAELQPVVLRGVVARGDLRRGDPQRTGSEVDEVGRGESEVDDVHAAARGALGERFGELRGRQPAVVAERDAGGAGPVGERGPDAPGDVRVELVGDDAANVVGLEDRREVTGGHDDSASYTVRRRAPGANDRRDPRRRVTLDGEDRPRPFGAEGLGRPRVSGWGVASAYRVPTVPSTDVNGTDSPSLTHHLASHSWQVLKNSWDSLTVMVIEMTSPLWHEGHLGW
jgi:hypothetical protein